MNKYCIGIEIPEGEVKKIVEELTEAQEKILHCYDRLYKLGVLTIKETPSDES